MANENDNLQDIEISELPQVEEGQEDTTDWKAEALKYQGIAKRLKTKVDKTKDTEPDNKGVNKVEKDNFDFGQLAFHNSKSNSVKIEANEDIEFLRQTIKDSGRSQSDILSSKWFSEEMKERQEVRASKEATPKHDNKSASSGKDTVDYWLNKGGLPEDSALRQKVVNARIARESGNGQNSGSSVVTGNMSGVEIK